MANRQIQELQPQELPLGQRVRTRSLPGQISAALLQPVYFFRTLPGLGETRQWLWVGLLILLLIGFSAVRQQSLAPAADTTGSDLSSVDTGGTDFSGGVSIDGGGLPGGFPGDGGIPSNIPTDGTTTDTTNTASVNDTLTTGIIAASGVVLGWLIVMILLAEVSLLRGRAPKFGKNFQIAVWASLPLALMALFQVLYFAAGGTPGQAGLAGLLPEWSEFTKQSQLVQSLLLSLASLLTVFWLWGLMMLYFGARFALNGSRFAAVLVVICWVLISVVTPVATGAIKAPVPVADEENIDGLPEFEGEAPTDGFPGEEPSIGGDVEAPVTTEEAGNGDLSGEGEQAGAEGEVATAEPGSLNSDGSQNESDNGSKEGAAQVEPTSVARPVKPAAPGGKG